MKPDTVNLIICIDPDFVQHACVMLASVFSHSKNIIHVHIITKSRESELIKLSRFVKKKRHKLTVYNINDEIFKGLKLSDHISLASYYRFLIPELITGVEKGIYLDSDILVFDDLTELMKINLNDNIIGAVFPDDEINFNAGVIIINFPQWVKENISRKLIDWAINNIKNTTFWDQDALNFILKDRAIKIEKKWNQIHSFNGAGILHFAGKHKPWSIHYEDIEKKYFYYKFLLKTPFIRGNYLDFIKIWLRFHLWRKK